jgi:hypothetical protein
MKVLFVGDNRTNVNWGRGASIALGNLLAGSFEISGRIDAPQIPPPFSLHASQESTTALCLVPKPGTVAWR